MRADGDPLGLLTKEEIRDLLGKGWLTHDGMWFVHAAAEFGIDRANELNRAAIRAMSGFEVQRLVAALRVDPVGITTSEDICRMFTDALTVLLPESVLSGIGVSAPEPGILRLEWAEGECFAYKGIRRAGLLDDYQCGVVYRIECWLEALGVRHRTVPPVGRCQMRVGGGCVSDFHLRFDS